MKKMLVLLLLAIFMISIVNAFEWDNRGNYNENTRTMKIRNGFGFGDVISEIKLNTPLNYEVALGYTKVAEIEIINNQEYPNALQKILFYDISNNMDEINRDFDYKVKDIKRIRVKDYKQICNNVFSVVNQTMEEVCFYVEDGGHFENTTVWNNLDKSSLKSGTLTIGIFTDVKINDKVEWIPTFFGIEIDEWASWTQSLSAGLQLYYNFNETSGTALPDVGTFNNNGTLFNMNDSNWVPGKIDNGLFFDGINDFVNTTFRENYAIGDNFTINFWYNTNNTVSGSKEYFGVVSGDSSAIGVDYIAGLKARFRVRDNTGQTSIPTTTSNVNTGLWIMQTLVRNTATDIVQVYINGVSEANFTDVTLTNINFLDKAIYLGARNNDGIPVTNTSGSFDEMGIWNRSLTIAEVAQLFNNGEGLTFPSPLNVELISPDNNTFFINAEVPFTCTATNHILLLQNVSFILDGVFNETTNLTVPVTNTTETFTKNLAIGSHNWTCEACDTGGTCVFASENRTLSVTIQEINQTFSANTTEGNTESFSASILLDESLSVSLAILVYNGTSFVGSSSSTGNDTTLDVSEVLIPPVEADVNLSFFWALLLSNGDTFNLTTQNQTVFALGIDNCSSFTNVILNFTNVDEELQTLLINSTIETAVNIFASDGTTLILNTSGSFAQNPAATCLNTPLTNQTNYLMNVIVKYTADGFAIEYFNIVDFVLTLQTVAQNITLFDLNLSDSTEFQLTFTGSDFLPEESVLVFVERQFIAENVFKTVELPLTDANGQTVLHLVRNNIIYNLRFIKDGITLGVFENIIAFCEDFTIGDCRLDLSAISNESAFREYDEFTGISYDSPPSFDSSTNLVSFSFVSDDGTAKIIVMTVERRDIFGNQTVCTNTVASTSGTLFCNIGANLTETTLFTIITVDGNDLVFNTVVIADSSFGDIGYALWFILTLMLLLMASDSKNAVVLVTLISYLGALSMGWFVGGAVGVGSSGVWILVISAAALWRINRRRN